VLALVPPEAVVDARLVAWAHEALEAINELVAQGRHMRSAVVEVIASALGGDADAIGQAAGEGSRDRSGRSSIRRPSGSPTDSSRSWKEGRSSAAAPPSNTRALH
jgi:hypothetical protein